MENPNSGGIGPFLRNRFARVVVIAVLYLVTRSFCLSRDLVSEEDLFLMPGQFLVEGAGYYFNWGVIFPHADPYQKPPLTSLLLGLGSILTPDGVTGARLAPFLVGLFVCTLPLLVTSSMVPSLLLLASPLLYSASGYLQTDPVVGLLGYALISWALARAHETFDARSQLLLIAGLIVLWMGKLELAALASAALVVYVPLQPSRIRRSALLAFVTGTIAGLGLFVLVSWRLGLGSGFNFMQSVGYTVNTVYRVTSSTIGLHAADGNAAAGAREWLWRSAKAFRVPELFLLLVVPAVAVIAVKRYLRARGRPHVYLLLLAILPVVIYMEVGYPGDGFPRYFLEAFPPLAVLLGLCLQECSSKWRLWISIPVLGLGAVTLLPMTWASMQCPGSVTVAYGETGAHRAADLAHALTKPGDLVLGPTNSLYYIRDRAWLASNSFEAYPTLHPKALALLPQVRAAIVPHTGRSAILDTVATSLRERGAITAVIGSFDVLAVPPE